jgi:hypothetical protein
LGEKFARILTHLIQGAFVDDKGLHGLKVETPYDIIRKGLGDDFVKLCRRHNTGMFTAAEQVAPRLQKVSEIPVILTVAGAGADVHRDAFADLKQIGWLGTVPEVGTAYAQADILGIFRNSEYRKVFLETLKSPQWHSESGRFQTEEVELLGFVQ